MHTNKINGRRYIGITCQKPEKRQKQGKGYRTNIFFYNAIQKYGWDNFKHEILYDHLTHKEACKKEIELISTYKTADRMFGYNHTSGGEHYEHNEETRKRMSDSHKGKYTGKGCAVRGRTFRHTDETKAKMSIAASKRRASDETRRKMSEAMKGKTLTEEQKCKISKANSKTIEQLTAEGDVVNVFSSLTEAGKMTGINIGSISSVCKGRYKQAGGYCWRYKPAS